MPTDPVPATPGPVATPATAPQPIANTFATASHEGFEVTSTHASEDEIKAALTGTETPPKAPEPPPAAPAAPATTPVAPELDDDDVDVPADGDVSVSDAARVLAGKKDRLKQRKQSYQEQIDTLRREKGDSERARDAVRIELAELERKKVAAQAEIDTLAAPPAVPGTTAAPVTPPRPVRPKLKDFDDLDQYHEALDRHFDLMETWQLERAREHAASETQKLITEQRTADTKAWQAERDRRETEAIQDAHQQRVAEFEKTHPDFKEAVYREGLAITLPMAHAIQRSPYGPQAAYYLSQHSDEALRIAQLAPADIFQEMGKLFWMIEVEATPPPQPSLSQPPAPLFAPVTPRPAVASSVPTVAVQSVSQASPPNKTLGAAPIAADDGPPPDSADWQTHQKYWDAYDRKRRQQGYR